MYAYIYIMHNLCIIQRRMHVNIYIYIHIIGIHHFGPLLKCKRGSWVLCKARGLNSAILGCLPEFVSFLQKHGIITSKTATSPSAPASKSAFSALSTSSRCPGTGERNNSRPRLKASQWAKHGERIRRNYFLVEMIWKKINLWEYLDLFNGNWKSLYKNGNNLMGNINVNNLMENIWTYKYMGNINGINLR